MAPIWYWVFPIWSDLVIRVTVRVIMVRSRVGFRIWVRVRFRVTVRICIRIGYSYAKAS